MIDMTLEELIGAVRLENETILLHSLPEVFLTPSQQHIMDGALRDAFKKTPEERKDSPADPSKSRA